MNRGPINTIRAFLRRLERAPRTVDRRQKPRKASAQKRHKKPAASDSKPDRRQTKRRQTKAGPGLSPPSRRRHRADRPGWTRCGHRPALQRLLQTFARQQSHRTAGLLHRHPMHAKRRHAATLMGERLRQANLIFEHPLRSAAPDQAKTTSRPPAAAP